MLLQMLFQGRMRRLVALASALLPSLFAVVLATVLATTLGSAILCWRAPFGFWLGCCWWATRRNGG